MNEELITSPPSIPLSDAEVYAEVERRADGAQWQATIVISREPGRERLKGEELNANLVDMDGAPSEIVERPTGPLTEAGGSLGVSVNAVFLFENTGRPPRELIVKYQDAELCFKLKPKS